ncbi:NtaA/DmoA family FMN-dependent monooxygenase [Methylosinus sp. H3A]|uniref:NtaA/DmoA family FMN-dependent monooxygenase n=1 Tax=Methylosinus sp. H3A TaxID=2785786 RepID=UPI0018C1FC93|nr:NtaA/DmoA family FMN-dependent monooxygenase [Methylosinus sp. H3A]MBG0808283.1 NtaA/DmoA family FMN-dependent monooxygenase [Methylosinus sp. H3A]
MSRRYLHVNVNASTPGSHPAAWRSPDANRFGSFDIEHFKQVALVAERGLLNAVFLPDQVSLSQDPSSGPGWGLLDPVVTVAHLSAVTEHIGFIATQTTSYTHPYNIARTFATLDHVTRGRIGLNLVTTMADAAARNFGEKTLPSPSERYARAAEFAEVLIALWDSWEDDALIGDVETGVFADKNRIHAINHSGQYFSVSGPLQVPRSPQGRPLLVQAGGSEQGRDLAARYAEAVFSATQYLSEAQAYYRDLKIRASGYGRDLDSLIILPGVVLFIGGTEEEARRRKRELDELDGDRGLERLAARLGVSVGDLDLDKPLPVDLIDYSFRGSHQSVGFADALRSVALDRTRTVRQILEQGGGLGHRTLIGSPEQIAADFEEWFVSGAADGFNIMVDIAPTGLSAFVDHVVPILQRRGLYRNEYEGRTLREHFGAARPKSAFEGYSQRIEAAAS